MQHRILAALINVAMLPTILLYWALPARWRVILDIPCLFSTLTGVKCPGCGMKTAILRLLELDWHGAVAVNPLAPAALSCIVCISANSFVNLVWREGEFHVRVNDDRAANNGEGFVARAANVVQQPAF